MMSLDLALRKCGIGPRVRERILRLNAGVSRPAGSRLRGWRPAPTAKMAMCLWDLISKGEIFRRFGRGAWENLEGWPEAIRKDGRRKYATRIALEDNLHMARPRA